MKRMCSLWGKKPSSLLCMKVCTSDLWHSCQNLCQAVLTLGSRDFSLQSLLSLRIRLQKLDAGCIGVEDWDLLWFTLTERRHMGMPTKKTQTLNKQKHAQKNNFPPPPPTSQIVVGGLQMKAWQGKTYHRVGSWRNAIKPRGFERTLGLAPSY